MSPRAIASTVVALVGLTLLNFWFAPDLRDLQKIQSSLGHGPSGYAALYDLLSEAGFSVDRVYARPDKLPADAVVWFVKPFSQKRLRGAPVPVLEDLRPWVEGGGTAVVAGDAGFDWSALGLETLVADGPVEVPSLTGDAVWRVDAGPEPLVFRTGEADAEVDGRSPPAASRFVVDVPAGEGRFVAIADSRFLQNPRLDRLDHAVLAAELARVYGDPLLDERFHGLRQTAGFVELIGAGRLAMLVATTALAAALAIRSRQRWLPRTLAEPDAIEATLESFVGALQHHYARTRDYAAVFQAYREGFVHRLQSRQPAPGLEAGFERRLARDANLDHEARRWLEGDSLPAREAEMTQAVRALERFADRRGAT